MRKLSRILELNSGWWNPKLSRANEAL